MESPSYGNLPPEIIMEILLRLPVKTLLRFKCVCKKWYTLIGSARFIYQHFGHESNRGSLLFWHWRPHMRVELKFAFYVDETYSVYEEPHPLDGLGGVLLGPSNGVFCICSCKNSQATMALLNLATRQVKLLPSLHLNVEPHLIFHITAFGFGLDPVSGDYKVVWIQYLWNKETGERHPHPIVNVYDSRSNSSRRLEDVDLLSSISYVSKDGTYLDGVYYWPMESKDSCVIIAFDMRSEKFREILVPDYIASPDSYLHLVLNGDSLALISVRYSKQTDRCANVWVMQNERCWARILTLSPLGDVSPFGFWKKNELILGGSTSIFALDGAKERLWTAETPVICNRKIRVRAYKESLVSINREGDNCMAWDTS